MAIHRSTCERGIADWGPAVPAIGRAFRHLRERAPRAAELPRVDRFLMALFVATWYPLWRRRAQADPAELDDHGVRRGLMLLSEWRPHYKTEDGAVDLWEEFAAAVSEVCGGDADPLHDAPRLLRDPGTAPLLRAAAYLAWEYRAAVSARL